MGRAAGLGRSSSGRVYRPRPAHHAQYLMLHRKLTGCRGQYKVCSTARGPSAGGRLMENSLRSPPPSYNALDSLTNPVHQCNLNHSTGVNINPRLNGKANRSNPRMLPAVGTSDVTLESAPEGNSFHTFNPSDSSSHVHRGSHLQKSDLFPKSRSHCDHPICSWWRWRGNEEKVY